MHIKSQKFFVLGISKSGKSVCDYILEQGSKCYVYEENNTPKILQVREELISKGAEIVEQENVDFALKEIDVLVISPGVPINHEIAIKAKKLGKRIISEIEFGFNALNPCVIAVTGTNGKTTTVSLIDSIIKADNKKSLALGNVGVPVTQKTKEIDNDTYCVTEVSSYQLESITALCPHVACVLNISPDHLERHYNMENYVFLKKRLIKNQRESEFSVLNFDDEIVKNFYTETKAKVVWVSREQEVDGAYIKDKKIYFKGEYITDVDKSPLSGEHNEYNLLFAVASAKIVGVSNIAISKGIEEFKGIPHRIELVKEKDGVKFYNDSKATNTASTISALKCMQKPTVLVLGGSEKGEDYTALFESVKNSLVIHTVLTGNSRFNMLEKAKQIGLENVTLTGDFELAIKIAKMNCFEGCNLLLSPGAASFDKFNSFEERGECFKKIVEDF